jgi:DMSO/TMAO reductase YedYZ molybdopterin-dependent catalytic subunit
MTAATAGSKGELMSEEKRKERGLFELYGQDPDRADELVFGRKAGTDRRGFLKGAGLAAMAAAVGAPIPFHRNFPAGLIPSALADTTDAFVLDGKDGLVVLSDRPINAETPAHLLDDDITPNSRHFIRNNGLLPPMAEAMDAEGWTLTVDGEVDNPLTLTLDDLKRNFKPVKLGLQLECGGNGRASFNPPATGNQWTVGAIGNAQWTGVRYRDVLNAAGLRKSAMYTGHYGMDLHLSQDPSKVALSRGVPISKALEEHSIIAYEMNGVPIPKYNGFPVRIVCPGWPASTSQKWLKRIWVRDVVHDGPKMTGDSYRVPRYPVAPGQEVPEEDFVIIESMPVKSLITSPAAGIELTGRELAVRGHAWAGERSVKAVDLSIDFGRTWIRTALKRAPNKYSWQTWTASVKFPQPGYYEIWARATDSEGDMQPFAVSWNPKGYLSNVMHRIHVTVA